MPLNKIHHSESRSAPYNSGTNPAIVDATKIAIQIRTASKSGMSFPSRGDQLRRPLQDTKLFAGDLGNLYRVVSTRLVNLNDERHPAFGIAEWKRLARVLMRDTIHVLEVAIGTMFDDATSELSFLSRVPGE